MYSPGSTRELEAAYDRLAPLAYAAALCACGRAEVAEEAVLDAFVAWRSAAAAAPAPPALGPALARAAERTAALRHPMAPPSPAADAPSRVLAAVGALPLRDRDAACLVALLGRNAQEAAALLGVEPGAVEAAAARAAVSLRGSGIRDEEVRRVARTVRDGTDGARNRGWYALRARLSGPPPASRGQGALTTVLRPAPLVALSVVAAALVFQFGIGPVLSDRVAREAAALSKSLPSAARSDLVAAEVWTEAILALEHSGRARENVFAALREGLLDSYAGAPDAARLKRGVDAALSGIGRASPATGRFAALVAGPASRQDAGRAEADSARRLLAAVRCHLRRGSAGEAMNLLLRARDRGEESFPILRGRIGLSLSPEESLDTFAGLRGRPTFEGRAAEAFHPVVLDGLRAVRAGRRPAYAELESLHGDAARREETRWRASLVDVPVRGLRVRAGGAVRFDAATSTVSIGGEADAGGPVAVLDDAPAGDVEILARFGIGGSVSARGGFALAARLRGGDGYAVRVADGRLEIGRGIPRPGAGFLLLDLAAPAGAPPSARPLRLVPGEWQRLRFQVAGAPPEVWVRVRAWSDDAAEPAGWALEGLDTDAAAPASGAVGLLALGRPLELRVLSVLARPAAP